MTLYYYYYLQRLEVMLKPELVQVCRNFGFRGYSKLKKEELLAFVTRQLDN
jgi:hypothetical protein